MSWTIERLRERCELDEVTGCWVWTLSCNSAGYPAISANGRSVSAHRLAYGLAFKPARRGQWVVRTCGDQLCINPEHLRALGQAAFTRKCVESGATRATPRRIEVLQRARAKRCKLDYERAEEIRVRAAAGETQRALAASYLVARSTIAAVVTGRRWAPPKPAWVPA